MSTVSVHRHLLVLRRREAWALLSINHSGNLELNGQTPHPRWCLIIVVERCQLIGVTSLSTRRDLVDKRPERRRRGCLQNVLLRAIRF